MCKRILLISSVALMLTACASGTSAIKVLTPPPASLTQPCPSLPPISDGTLPSLINNHQQITSLYHDCRKRHALLVEWEMQKERLSE